MDSFQIHDDIHQTKTLRSSEYCHSIICTNQGNSLKDEPCKRSATSHLYESGRFSLIREEGAQFHQLLSKQVD